MATATKTENFFEKITAFYLDQFEKLGPKAKEAMEDWFEFSGKAWEQYFKLQNDFWSQFTSGKDATADFAEQTKSFAQSALNAQKEMAAAAIDIATKNARAFSNKTTKRTTAKKAAHKK
jgi:hypothetical protein